MLPICALSLGWHQNVDDILSQVSLPNEPVEAFLPLGNALSVLLRSQTRRHTVKGAIHVVELCLPAQVPSTSKSNFLPEESVVEQLAAIQEFSIEMPSQIGEKSHLAEEREESARGENNNVRTAQYHVQ